MKLKKKIINISTINLKSAGQSSKLSRTAVPGVDWIFGPNINNDNDTPAHDRNFNNDTNNDFPDVPLY